ncbi:MAG: lipopolysaccharide biosynthesis protein [Flavobacteriaceae bacterium]|nr:lipopolysaccharide biosynthesis protein [Flavobacteriaceae bacterium]
MGSLKQKSINGVIWTLIEKFGIQFIKLILGVILARLLTPSDYGLIGMITVFFAIARIFIDSGFGMAYIQKKDANDEDASTIFYFNLAVSTFFYGVMWFSAPWISDFYEQDQLVSLIRTMSIVLIFNSFGLIQLTKLKKDVNFKKRTLLILISAILATSSGIAAALLDYGVWSLVIQEIVRAVVKNVGLWIFYKWRPLMHFNINSLKSLFSFSVWALLSSILTAVFNNIYLVVIGKFFSAAQLGFYTKANQFQKMISHTPSNAIGSVAFPVFSKLQDNNNSLKESARKFNTHSIFFIAPIAAIFFIIAKPFFLVLLTEKWLPMVPYFQLLLLAGVFYPVHMINVQLLIAIGKIKLNFNLSIVKNILRIVNIVFMYRYGVIFIIYGEVVLSVISLLINTYYTKRLVSYGLTDQIKDIFAPLFTSSVLVIIGFELTDLFSNSYFKIVSGIIFIICFYNLIMYFLNKQLLLETKNIIVKKLSINKKAI